MKGDLVIRKKYVDVIDNFLFGERYGFLMFLLSFLFWLSMLVIEICCIAFMAYISGQMGNFADSIQWTYVIFGYPVWRGNVIFAGLSLWSTAMFWFAIFVVCTWICDVVIASREYNKDRL